MITLRHTESLAQLIALLVAYVVTVSLTGFVRAWTAEKMGDDTAEEMGFLTLNPAMHVYPIGLVILFIFGFGWGRYIPIDSSKIRGRWRSYKITLAFLSDSLANFVLAFIAIIVLLFQFGVVPLCRWIPMMMTGHLSLVQLAAMHPDRSSMSIVVALVLVALIFLNVLLGVLHVLVNGFDLVMLLGFKRHSGYSMTDVYARFVMVLVLIIVFSEYLRWAVMIGIMKLGCFLGMLLGFA